MNFVKIKLYFCRSFPPISRLLRPVSCHLIDTPDPGPIKINFQICPRNGVSNPNSGIFRNRILKSESQIEA